MPRFTLHRRTLLTGAPGVALGLPILEIMSAGKKAEAAIPPRRFVCVYGGFSLVRDGSPLKLMMPRKIGKGYDLPRELSPLGPVGTDRSNGVRSIAAYGVQDEVSVVSGLKIPWSDPLTAAAPSDGWSTGFHGHTGSPFWSGTAGYDGSFGGPSADQVVAASFAAGAPGLRFPGGLQYQVQASAFENGSSRGQVCFRQAPGGGTRPVAFETSPRQAFDTLFTNFSPNGGGPEDVAAKEAQAKLIAREKSIIDFVMGRAERLKARLGKPDRDRLAAHFDAIRDLEKLITSIPPTPSSPACKKPNAPGSDPTEDSALTEIKPGVLRIGWTGEDLRAQAMRELAYRALACDSARSLFIQITMAQSYLNTERINGVRAAVHDGTHGAGSDAAVADTVAWHAELFAWLVKQLRDTTDIDGTSRMIDNTVLLFGTEGGAGFVPEGGSPAVGSHSTENMTLLVAGGRNLGLHPGQHLTMNNAQHPAAVIRTAMRAVGVDRPLGTVSDSMPSL